MKKFLLFLSVAVLCACSSSVDDVQVYTLSVDKNVIEADGKDKAVFTITDAEGNVITTEDNMGRIYFKNVSTGFSLPRRSISFSSIANGEYEFSGSFRNIQTKNTVKIKAQNRKKYELYHRNIGLFKCTSVWCSACPGLSDMLYELHSKDMESKEHSVILSCHGKFDGKQDIFAINTGSTDLGNAMIAKYGGSGWPTLIYDMEKSETGVPLSASELSEKVMARRLEHPATCGIKIISSSVDGNAIKVTASMKTSAAGSYDLTAALVKDNLYYDGGYSVGGQGIFDDVLIAIQSNFMMYSNETGKSMNAGEEMTRTFTFDFGANLPALTDLEVVAFAHRKTTNGRTVMDNIISVPFGQTSEYILND